MALADAKEYKEPTCNKDIKLEDLKGARPKRSKRRPREDPLSSLVQAQILPERTDSERRAKNLALVGFVIAAMLVIFFGIFFGNG